MARRILTGLESPTARQRLPVSRHPEWVTLRQGLSIGYRKGSTRGAWVARLRIDGTGAEDTIGIADDRLPADGDRILSFDQARAAAEAWAKRRTAPDAETEAPKIVAPLTVADAYDEYVGDFKARGGRGLAQLRSVAQAHVLPPLRKLEIRRLTSRHIRDWHRKIATGPALLRSGRAATKRNERAQSDDPEALRKRRATANRCLSVLKAILNFAWREHRDRVPNDEAWRSVQPFPKVDKAVIRWLTDAEAKRLVNAAAPEFRPLVQAGLLTGCRWGELAALHCADFNKASGTLTIRASKSGKARHVVLTDEGRQFFDAATIGRAPDAPVFTRTRGTTGGLGGRKVTGEGAWRTSEQVRPMREACTVAKIAPAVGFHVLRHTHASRLAMAAVPMGVIAAQLGHADTRQTEKHYAHLAPSYVADTIRAAFTPMGIVPPADGKVADLLVARGRP